jgi:hypothetical protein
MCSDWHSMQQNWCWIGGYTLTPAALCEQGTLSGYHPHEAVTPSACRCRRGGRSGSTLQLKSSRDGCQWFVQGPEREPSQLRRSEQVNVNPAQTAAHQTMGVQERQGLVMNYYWRLR